jgi:hypothetical protein
MTFMMVDAARVEQEGLAGILGAAGGALAYQGDGQGALTGLAVEVDLWSGGTDPSGYNSSGYGHVAVVRDGDVNNHVQTCVDYNPDLIPVEAGGTGWPYFVQNEAEGAGWPLHFVVTYNNGRVTVELEAPETTSQDGVSFSDEFERQVVLDTGVSYPDGADEDDLPDVLSEAYIGFTAGTGGAVAFHDVDNLTVSLLPKVVGFPVYTGDANCDGNIDIADAICILGHLFGPAEDACKQPCCQANMDTNDQGGVDIADAIKVLTFLFGTTGKEMLAPDGSLIAPGADGCFLYPLADVTEPCDTPCTPAK